MKTNNGVQERGLVPLRSDQREKGKGGKPRYHLRMVVSGKTEQGFKESHPWQKKALPRRAGAEKKEEKRGCIMFFSVGATKSPGVVWNLQSRSRPKEGNQNKRGRKGLVAHGKKKFDLCGETGRVGRYRGFLGAWRGGGDKDPGAPARGGGHLWLLG